MWAECTQNITYITEDVIFSIFLEDRVFIYILHLVECNTLIYDKQAVRLGGSAGGKGGRREFNRNNST